MNEKTKLASLSWITWQQVYFVNLVLLCAIVAPSLASAQDELPKQEDLGSLIDPTDEMELRSQIKGWLRDWKNPRSPEVELYTVESLFGYLGFGRRYEPTREVKDKLIKRRLKYDNWESRRAAVNGFLWFLVSDEDDPEPIIPIFVDGLDDPHHEVRKEAVLGLSSALSLIENGPLATKWSTEMNQRLEARREELIDDIVVNVITKGIIDESMEVVERSFVLLRSAESAPTKSQLRALERIIAMKSIHFEVYLDQAKEIRSAWQRTIDGGLREEAKPTSEPDDEAGPIDNPFGSGVPPGLQ